MFGIEKLLFGIASMLLSIIPKKKAARAPSR
jgi:hypothetical protein